MPKNGPVWTGKKDRFANIASATAPASNKKLSEFLISFPTLIELSTACRKTSSDVKKRTFLPQPILASFHWKADPFSAPRWAISDGVGRDMEDMIRGSRAKY